MPVLIVYGMSSTVEQDKIESLIGQLQHVLRTSFDISPNNISVFFPPDLVQRGLDEEIVCFVDGLFEEPGRTVVVRQNLANAILSILTGFASRYLTNCGKVEVIVKRFDQTQDGFASCDPYEEK